MKPAFVRQGLLAPTLLAACVLSACSSLGPAPTPLGLGAERQRAAQQSVPATLNAQGVDGTVAAATPRLMNWRQVVQDPRLVQVIDTALDHNRDLRLAVLAIDQARASWRVAAAGSAPTVRASAGVTVNGDRHGETGRQASVGLGVSAWELDLWGRLSQQQTAAMADVLASDATRDAVQAALVAEVAQAWLAAQAQGELQALAERTLASREDTLKLMRTRHDAGVQSGLDVAASEAAVQAARGEVAQARTARAQALNALRLLVGAELPGTLLPVPVLLTHDAATDAARAATPAPTDAVALVAVPAGLSSEVLLARPDVRAAEQAVVAARADLGAARAALFPTVSLTASAGFASAALGQLLTGGAFTWALAPALQLPLFDGGARQAQVDVADVAQRRALVSYEKALQTAFKEVADALAEREQLAERMQAQRGLVDAYRRSLQLAQTRYRGGADSPLTVLEAQRTLLAAEQALISLTQAEQANRLTLYKVLGGA